MSSSSAIFSGNSRYASDFQSVIERSVAIASMPLTQLQNQRSNTASEQTAISSLASKFSTLRTALDNIDSGTTAAPTATLSNSAVARVTAASGAQPTEMNLEVINLGSYSTSLSNDGLIKVTDPTSQSITSDEVATLTINGVPMEIHPPVGSLNALAQAINEKGAGVQASVVNIGGPGAADYRLALRSTDLGGVTIDLSDSTGSIATQYATGTTAQYRVNGFPATAVDSTSRKVTIAPGVTAELAAVGSTDISLTPNATKLQDYISAFVTAFNAAGSEIDTHRGQGTGALSGQSLPSELGNTLRELMKFETTGSTISNPADLGLSLDRNGTLLFNTATFATAFADNNDAVRGFLGGESSGGFLQSMKATLDTVDGLTGGVLTDASSQVAKTLVRQDDQIAEMQNRIDVMETNLKERMAASDAAIALLEQQVTLITGLFSANNNSNN
ncbi:flagellar filament capping protein FliD [Paludibaculum fermentans]|uniref:Flagellar hook-associated protein 2 n=1 Tax=Paludibaculum fermentans TaxID=1473598 RepID=A0A7S7NSA8_PALFE|nr:flagellar filament capping protein FliD [Paludibaculum fermentans]QOY88872.1 flagellar filament capping protein FliD [Paludibaculum fermentans]